MPIKFMGQNLSKSFGKRRVVSDVSFEVSVGEAVGFLGPNGAGKTTCFLMLAGVLKPDTGSLHLNNLDITYLPLYRKARLGLRYLPQDASIFRGLTVEQNLMAVLELLEEDPLIRQESLERLLNDFNLGHIRRSPALVLSGGERRRVEIARALAGNPKFLLLDEPLAGIDPKSIDELRQIIEQLRRRQIGIIISDHNVRDTLGIVDRAYIIYQGEVLCHGTPDFLVQNQQVRDVYFGDKFYL